MHQHKAAPYTIWPDILPRQLVTVLVKHWNFLKWGGERELGKARPLGNTNIFFGEVVVLETAQCLLGGA